LSTKRITGQSEQPSLACGLCGVLGKRVSAQTISSQLRQECVGRIQPGAYRFCDSTDCDAVYYLPETMSVFVRAELELRVGQKETEDPIQVCYCFGYFRSDIEKDVVETGDTEIPQVIKARTKAGECSCETSNPGGG